MAREKRWSRLAGARRRMRAAIFAVAVLLTPALALAQGSGGGGGAAGSAAAPPPSGGPGHGGASGVGAGKLLVAWIAVILVAAVVFSLITRARGGPAARHRS